MAGIAMISLSKNLIRDNRKIIRVHENGIGL
jgi:hypothetical protein